VNDCQIPECENATVTIPGGFTRDVTTIDYTYDPLYRLLDADYSSGDTYAYTYDAVGNRQTQDSNVSGLELSFTYNYDIANRLTDVDGVPYVYDDNGNLLNDGVNEYTYDSANRLTSDNGTGSYTYNGLGDRLSQNGVNYTLDLNAGLTQVLSDGTTSYTYGLGRISQQSGNAPEYFLGDALGSVRQLTDQTGAITYAASYDPYGVVTQVSGEGQSAYGYTAESQDVASGMVYLRARYYNPVDGRFVSRDTWEGDEFQPVTYNKWTYANANPTYYVDPSGQVAIPVAIALALRMLGGGIVGGAIGFGAGYLYGCATYESALTGKCGCDMLQKALTMSRNEWINHFALGGAMIGAAAGALGSIGVEALIVVALVSGGISIYDIYQTYKIIENETGPTLCTALRILFDAAGVLLSFMAIRAGLGSGNGTINSAGVAYPKLKVPGYGEIPFPEPPYGPNNTGLRNSFTTTYKNNFKTWWITQGRPWPSGKINIHHIKPLQFGGTNAFENLVPLSIPDHFLYTSWWRLFKP
jgi:RHS repeat-associated protein